MSHVAGRADPAEAAERVVAVLRRLVGRSILVVARDVPLVLRAERWRGQLTLVHDEIEARSVRTACRRPARGVPAIEVTDEAHRGRGVVESRREEPSPARCERPPLGPRDLLHRRVETPRLAARDLGEHRVERARGRIVGHARVLARRCSIEQRVWRVAGGVHRLPERVVLAHGRVGPRIGRAGLVARSERRECEAHEAEARPQGVPRGSAGPSRGTGDESGVCTRDDGRMPAMSPTTTSLSSAKIGSRP